MDAFLCYCNNLTFSLLKPYAMRYKIETFEDLQLLSTMLSTTFSTCLWILITSARIKENIARSLGSLICDLDSPSERIFFFSVLNLQNFII